MSDKRIKGIIQALLAKANATDNEHEASAFLAKAMDMLQQYQLDIRDLVDAGDPILNHSGLSRASSGHAWRWKIYAAVARMYGCETLHSQHMLKNEDGSPKLDKHNSPIPGYTMKLVGRESAIITTELMYPWIVEQIKAAGARLAPVTGMSVQGQTKRVAAALYARINRMNEEAASARPATAAGRNALVILDAVKAAFDAAHPDAVTSVQAGSRVDALSIQAAHGIGLHRQTSGVTLKRLA